eukprot:TRINITY_DN214_c0_g1_i4.p1 TRINITY_DN214_c0_g1~~TRINITY_DN214_c0_g1_i4.p1  ORF type:complete len:379 (-),score=45.19 TRINITY_DN214_c0_g1_i4:234-1370(-)
MLSALSWKLCLLVSHIHVTASQLPEQLNSAETASSSPSVAALVPVYEGDFQYFEKFVKQWHDCPEAHLAMALYVVFSSSAAAQAFKTRMDAAGVSSSSWSTLLISTGDDQFPRGANPRSWKKLDALAQLLDAQRFPGLEFAIMMDAEIALNSCEGFADVPRALRAKFESRVWYADPGLSLFYDHFIRAANSIMVDCADPAQSARLLEQTNHFKVNTWWQDVPWVELNSARRMYSMWSDMLTRNQTYRTCKAEVPTSPLQQIEEAGIAIGSGPLTPTEVSASMGSFSLPLKFAATAFEHLVYQYYMVVHEGFRIEVLDINGECWRGSFAETLWRKEEKDVDLYMNTVKPLWVKFNEARASPFAPPNGTAVIAFHTDREC